MILRIILACCIFLNSCDKLGNNEEAKVKTYTKQEKLKMLDVMLSKLLKDIQEKKNFIPILEVSDEHSGYTIDSGSYTGEEMDMGKFQKKGLGDMEKNVSVEEVVRLLKKGSKEMISDDGGSLWVMLEADRFEYGIDLFFPEKEGRWIVRSFSRLRPERD
ncbi:hypothetical protein [Leptospira stimsonii]|uniref:Uncharacterized protein n=1 Tax=Leptospira stimsonii TaxID=2202203 RepID=A0A4R9L9S4_9LEPT|nr:hypothetical protein [Leptospira stimsonii]RHX82881.1 hypothetical protein DLM78_23660 [Leptospira stimsonii]TGK10112.1 hypothetical protein EHO98_23165 [Leptospira stimsonii]TGM18752.1 hypothetical protein EHQ90_06610 [Leptospira stimsonii]